MKLIMEKAPTAASLGTAVGVGLWGLTVDEWMAIGGFALALVTLLINLYYKRLHYKLAQGKKKEKKK